MPMIASMSTVAKLSREMSLLHNTTYGCRHKSQESGIITGNADGISRSRMRCISSFAVLGNGSSGDMAREFQRMRWLTRKQARIAFCKILVFKPNQQTIKFTVHLPLLVITSANIALPETKATLSQGLKLPGGRQRLLTLHGSKYCYHSLPIFVEDRGSNPPDLAIVQCIFKKQTKFVLQRCVFRGEWNSSNC